MYVRQKGASKLLLEQVTMTVLEAGFLVVNYQNLYSEPYLTIKALSDCFFLQGTRNFQCMPRPQKIVFWIHISRNNY